MLSFAKSAPCLTTTNKIEQSLPQKLPVSAVLWDVLRGIEMELQRKGLLSPPAPASFNPLWFVAETERNVFLWQKGCSLIDQDQFEFWIDIPKLVQKRIRQLERQDGNNPFTNPLWGQAEQDSSLVECEREYLEQFDELLSQIEGHAHALSIVGSEVQRELHGRRPRVVLPSKRSK
jgi:hypothetical protein